MGDAQLVGLYLHPPEHAIVLCVDEKSQIQALERTQPVRPVVPDALSGTPTTTSATAPPPRAPLLPPTSRQGLPRRRLHVICDTYATHKHQKVQAWLARHPRVQLHFIPTSASWLNLVEVFFSIVERQALRRGDFASAADLVAAIGRFISAGNQRRQPFVWTKDADTILAKLNRRTAATVRSASASLSP